MDPNWTQASGLNSHHPAHRAKNRDGRNWARTSDPQLVELVLSQLSYAPGCPEFSYSRELQRSSRRRPGRSSLRAVRAESLCMSEARQHVGRCSFCGMHVATGDPLGALCDAHLYQAVKRYVADVEERRHTEPSRLDLERLRLLGSLRPQVD